MKKPSYKKMVLASTGIVLFLGLSVVINHKTVMMGFASESESMASKQARGPSSFSAEVERSGSLSAERLLASELAPYRNRSIASVGRPADLFENLKYGVLEGKYALRMNGDKIAEIKFIDNPQSEGRPTELKNRAEFLRRYSLLLDTENGFEKVSVDIQGTKTTEIYRVKSDKPGHETLVSFVVDEYDRLLELHAEKTTRLRIF